MSSKSRPTKKRVIGTIASTSSFSGQFRAQKWRNTPVWGGVELMTPIPIRRSAAVSPHLARDGETLHANDAPHKTNGSSSRVLKGSDLNSTDALRMVGYGAYPKRENGRVAAANWGGADSFEGNAHGAG